MRLAGNNNLEIIFNHAQEIFRDDNLKPVALSTIINHQKFYLETADSFLVECEKTSSKAHDGYIHVIDIRTQKKIYLNPSQTVYIPQK